MPDEQVRALVIEDDPDAAEFARIALRRFARMSVDVAADAQQALAALAGPAYDVVVSDIELPGRSGLDILPRVRELQPGVPVMIVTAHGSLTNAVEALRREADDFFVKPVTLERLAERAGELAEQGRERRAEAAPTVVLAVGAHPDDVEIGVGGTLAAHAGAGDSLVILTLSGGSVGGAADVRQQEAEAAAAVVCARLIHLDFADTRIDPAGGVITAVEQVITEVKPDRIYTHSAHDRHQDHRAVHEAVQIAARRVPGLWCFQSPSCTVEFRPNRFVDITGFLDTKLAMLAAYVSQAHRDYMQPDLIRATARYWSRFGPGTVVEPLETVRAAESVGRRVPVAGMRPLGEPGSELTAAP
ncbi:MAG: response regulator [Microlunatus sp.]|nr:response regulator [Microlunatus sp.]MDN5769936.1 response regulator [Microlunatus sp.]